MPPEVIAGYFDIIDNKPYPVIKARYAYLLENGDYLLEIVTTDQTRSRSFSLAIISE
jgi:hypothetical protein